MRTSPAWHRRLAGTRLPALLFLAVMTSYWSRPAAAQIEPSPPPVEAHSALPVGAAARATLAGDLTGDGAHTIVTLFDMPAPPGVPSESLERESGLAFTIHRGGGQVALQITGFTGLDAAAATLTTLPTPGAPAVLLSAPTGAHTGRLVVMLWDGRSFQSVFDGETPDASPSDLIGGMRGLGAADRDGDGVPEIIRREPSFCIYNWAGPPRNVTVFRWDGAAFTDATAAYPDLLAAAVQEAREVLATNDQATVAAGAAGQACVHGLLAELARKAGDSATAQRECRLADALAPDWKSTVTWQPSVCE